MKGIQGLRSPLNGDDIRGPNKNDFPVLRAVFDDLKISLLESPLRPFRWHEVNKIVRWLVVVVACVAAFLLGHM